MNRHRRDLASARVVILVAACILCPSAARAQGGGWWDYLEQLSGPGPFDGWSIGGRVVCFAKDRPGADQGQTGPTKIVGLYGALADADRSPGSPRRACLANSDDIRGSLVPRFSHLGTGEKRSILPDAPDDLRTVHANWIELFAMLRADRALSVGFGGGTLFLTGEGFKTQGRLTLTPIAVEAAPLALFWRDSWTRAVVLSFQETYIKRGYTAAQFGSPTSAYSTEGDYVRRFQFEIDAGAVIYSITRRH